MVQILDTKKRLTLNNDSNSIRSTQRKPYIYPETKEANEQTAGGWFYRIDSHQTIQKITQKNCSKA